MKHLPELLMIVYETTPIEAAVCDCVLIIRIYILVTVVTKLHVLCPTCGHLISHFISTARIDMYHG